MLKKLRAEPDFTIFKIQVFMQLKSGDEDRGSYKRRFDVDGLEVKRATLIKGSSTEEEVVDEQKKRVREGFMN